MPRKKVEKKDRGEERSAPLAPIPPSPTTIGLLPAVSHRHRHRHRHRPRCHHRRHRRRHHRRYVRHNFNNHHRHCTIIVGQVLHCEVEPL